ncbi:MAG TPA: glycosyltransferase family 4 protein [Gemmatimonadaceae bacterium]|nr:glycosyltransferase family 4 protein [Gemmatimonadaceae bacterium]
MTTPKKLRIAMMLDSDGQGGAEMMIYRLSEELRERGHIVVPVLPRDGVGWLGELFRSTGSLPDTFWLKRPIDPTAVRRLMQLFVRHKIDVVHSHEFTMAVYGAAAAKLLGIPHVLTMHGSQTVNRALRRRIALRWAMRRSAHSVAVSNATQDQFSRELGVRANAFTVIHNGVPVTAGNAEQVRKEFGCTGDEIVMLAVGNLDTRKNHRLLLEAVVLLESEGLTVPWKVIIAGGRGGDQHSHLRDYVRSHGLEDRVHIVTGRNDIADLQAITDIFVMPSLWEGLPMAMLEAMVAGKAIIASETAGIPEAIVNGREGILVPPGDLQAFASSLRILLTDAERRRTLAAAAQERATREFTVQVMTERYLGLYTRAVAARG